ncbi:hypothetical protein HaLaN_26501, partial [Haematococcus lacustris]
SLGLSSRDISSHIIPNAAELLQQDVRTRLLPAVMCPRVLLSSVDTELRPRVQYLRQQLGLEAGECSFSWPAGAAAAGSERGLAGAAAAAHSGDLTLLSRANLRRNLLNELGPRFSYARDRQLLHCLLDYDPEWE